MLGPSSHLVGAIDKLPFISCAKNTTGTHCSEAGFPMMRGSAIAISVGDRLVRDVEHRDAVPAYAARTAVAPVGITFALSRLAISVTNSYAEGYKVPKRVLRAFT